MPAAAEWKCNPCLLSCNNAGSSWGGIRMSTAKTTILLAEDDPNDVFLMQRAFKKAEFSSILHVVPNGEQAIAYLSGHQEFGDRLIFPIPALILLDLKMPRRSGLEVLTWIRKQDSSIRRIPVVMLTSSKQNSDVNQAYDLGANSYLVKPVTFEKLLEQVLALGHFWLKLSQPPEIASFTGSPNPK